MAKIKLGNRPESFTHPIKFPMLDGTTGTFTVEYRYRTRKEFGALVDEMVAAAKVDRQEDGEFSMTQLLERTAGSNAQYIMKAVRGWDLDEEFTLENVQQLADELPAAVNTLMEDYRRACVEGRLGN